MPLFGFEFPFLNAARFEGEQACIAVFENVEANFLEVGLIANLLAVVHEIAVAAAEHDFCTAIPSGEFVGAADDRVQLLLNVVRTGGERRIFRNRLSVNVLRNDRKVDIPNAGG